jgi:hypothetical protein
LIYGKKTTGCLYKAAKKEKNAVEICEDSNSGQYWKE